jgi:hypothetical protein
MPGGCQIVAGGSVRTRKLKPRASASRSRAENGALDGLHQSDASPDRRVSHVMTVSLPLRADEVTATKQDGSYWQILLQK